jgi:hypothetical protein
MAKCADANTVLMPGGPQAAISSAIAVFHSSWDWNPVRLHSRPASLLQQAW